MQQGAGGMEFMCMALLQHWSAGCQGRLVGCQAIKPWIDSTSTEGWRCDGALGIRGKIVGPEEIATDRKRD